MPTKPIAFRIDRSRQVAPQVFDALRERILELELVPGTVLSRAELAATFGVSQTPIRDALLRLDAEGLVVVFPQHATVVSRIDVAAATEAHFLRRAIECEVARTLCERPDDPALLARLETQIALQTTSAAQGAHAAFIEADRGFHRLMYEAAGVSALFELVRRRSGHIDRLRRLHLYSAGKMRTIVAEHRRLVEAIAAGDGEAAQATLRGHLSGTLARLESIRRRHPDYFVG